MTKYPPLLRKRWVSNGPDPAASVRLARELGLSPVTAQVLVARGYDTPAAARAFLDAGRATLHDPFRLQDMDKAVAILQARLSAGLPVLVYGDYDVDGITGTALLVSALRAAGATVEYYIPNRLSEGYGLNAAALTGLREQGHDFVLCVDTGVAAVAEAEHARDLGMTLIITDHHEPGEQLPNVAALVNPKRPDCQYPFPGLAGAGVAFKLVHALLGAEVAWSYLDIVALATIADVVPLVDENRALVREGLPLLGATQRPGLVALKEIAGVAGGPTTPVQVGFALGPRLNALGRMGDARLGVELLLTADLERARELARHLDAENRVRRETQAAVLAAAMAQLAEQPAPERSAAVVLAGADWHHGVLGICAARVVETTWRPALLLSITGDEARGSARSVPGFPLHTALTACADLLDQYGGHAMAAGLTLRAGHVPALRQRLNRLAAEWLGPEGMTPAVAVDAWLPAEWLTLDLTRELQSLAPYGFGNPEPVLAVRDITLAEARPVGRDGSHLKFRLAPAGGPAVSGIAFGQATAPDVPGAGQRIAVAFTPEIREWQGRERLEIRAVDLRAMALDAADLSAPDPDASPTVAWDPAGDCVEAAAPAQLECCIPAAGDPLDWLVEQRRPGQPLLVVVQAPWSVAPVVAALRRRLPGACPVTAAGPDRPAAVLVTHWSGLPQPGAGGGPWLAAMLHPPFHLGQAHQAGQLGDGRLLALWRATDWELGRIALGWPYPERPELVRIFRLLQQQTKWRRPAELAAGLTGSGCEPIGSWNLLRVHAALKVFAELGLVAANGDGAWRLRLVADSRLSAGGGRDKMNLEASMYHRRGVELRGAYSRCQEWFTGAGFAGLI